jgi:hypothetical protein
MPELADGGRYSTARQPHRYRLDDRTDLRTHFKASGLFDSQLEADFAAEFEEKYGGAERKWELAREDELIVLGDTVMIPDFSFTHARMAGGRYWKLWVFGSPTTCAASWPKAMRRNGQT